MPMITGGVVVTRVEVYITNRVNNTQSLRNIASFLDLGNPKPYRQNNATIGTGTGTVAANGANNLFKTLSDNATVRNIDNLNTILGGFQLEKGTDYEVLRAARRLSPNEFMFHPNLGYISLQTPVRNDEIVAVSFEYTFNGQRYTVGELTESYQSLGATDAIILKLLKPSTIRTDLPTWDLMMKNIYSLNTNQVSRDNFQLRVIYRDDLTGVDNPNLQEGLNTKDIPLLQIFGLDRLNQNNDPQPDGNFDFVAGNSAIAASTATQQNNMGGGMTGMGGSMNNTTNQNQNIANQINAVTIVPELGRIIFPVLEPFGRTLDAKFLPEQERDLRNKYVFDELYRKTQMDAQLLTSKSKFFIKGSFQSATGAEIRLPGINIAPRSVQVQAGGTTLMEGSDYSVDYQMGLVRITNTGVLASGKEIRIQYERADLFNFQTRNLFGIDAQYLLSKNTKFTTTLMHLNERPIISRVNIGAEPTRNTLVGFGVHHREDDARLLTKLVDKLPFYSTKEKSAFTVTSEVAALIPGTNTIISKDGGTSFIDDFEAAEIPYDLGRQPVLWQLGSTPQSILEKFPVGLNNPRAFSAKRAKMSWYNVDFTAFEATVGGANPPSNLTLEDRQNHYTRPIPFNEIVNPDANMINLPEQVMNLSYYPNERGQYNFSTELNADGTLRNPRENFASITKGITSDVDFDNINVQYVEFWMLDPFIRGKNGEIISTLPNGQKTTINNNTGGKLYFNIGNISEDVIPDSRHGFENGLPTDSVTVGKVRETAWGRVTEQQFLTNAFASEAGARQRQDVGLDGISDEEEKRRYAEYLRQVQGVLSPEAFQRFANDPAGDNFKYYLGDDLNNLDYKVLDRYKFYNGTENNSPENAGTASYTTFPDNEDLNRDNSLNDVEGYYEYEVDLRPGQIQSNGYIVDRVTKNVNGDNITWYQFRIPIREGKKVGAIDGFKSMRFVRMYMTDWQQPAVVRLARFQFVGTPWRPFTENLQYPGANLPSEPYNVNNFRVSSISIINNGKAAPNSGITPYQEPPGFVRDINLASNTQARLNEQSLRICVDGLEDRDARAVYKNLIVDMVNYKRLKMFLHAESQDAKDGEVTAFIRLGTDFKENFYEIEVPLTMTPFGELDQNKVWPADNEIDIATQDLIDVKARRNNSRLSLRVPYIESIGRFKVTVIGNPDLSSVQTLMIGVRNPESADGKPKSVCIWANELRVADFNDRAGWATRTAFNAKLADLAIVNANFRYVSPFFGGIQDKISQRTRNHTFEYDVNMALQMHKFGLYKYGINLPLYVGLERRILTPYFNPLDPDTPLTTSLDAKDNPDDFASLVREDMVARTINLQNVGKTRMNTQRKPKPWDVENWSLNFSYMERVSSNIRTAEYLQANTRLGLAYMFASQAKPIEPFKENKDVEGKYLKFIKEFNFNPLPNTFSVRGDFERRFVKTQFRNGQLTTLGVMPLFEKAFNFNRSYMVAWSITKNLRVDYMANAMAVIDEPSGEINNERANRFSSRTKQDSVLYNLLNLGRVKNFMQKTSLTYKLPLDKFPITDWVSSEVKYEGGYNWTAGTLGVADSLGNMMSNSQNMTLSGQMNMKQLYDKSRLLKSIGQSGQGGGGVPQAQPTVSKYEGKRLRLQAREARLIRRKERIAEKFEEVKINLQLDTVKIAEKKVKYDARIAKKDEKIAKVREKLAELDQKEKNDANPNQEPAAPVRVLLKGLMMVQKINFSYSETNSTDIPGVLTTPTGAFGMSSDFSTPGWGFVFGSQDPTVKDNAARNGWLGRSASQNNMFRQGTTRNLQLGAVLEPIKEMQIMLNAKRTQSGNYSEIFSFNPTNNQFTSQTPNHSGMYSISYFSLLTAFSGDNAANQSEIFNNFMRNRGVIRGTLDAQNTQGDYDRNSQDVLIPSFLAAYSGRDINSVGTSAFPQIPMPNWKMTYNGLSNLPIFKPYFRSIQLEHGYSSEYSTGSFQSSLIFADPSLLRLNIDLQNLPLALLDPASGKLTPLFVMNQVMITEAFAPLIGIRLKTAKNISINVRYNMNRGVALNMSNAQVTELKNSDITVDVGFTKANFKIPFKINGSYKTLKNDLTFACALTIRDTKTAQRSIKEINAIEVQEAVVTQGNMNFQIRPTVNYVLNQRASLQFYFDYMVNSPYVSNSFRRSTTAFGIQMRFALQ
jgi:cell surface protein SprA